MSLQTPSKNRAKTINTSKMQHENETANKSNAAKFNFPACWQDEQRMTVLLATFRPRLVNAESYDAKMKFWQNLIADYLKHKGEAFFCKQDLLVAFAHGARTPHCLDEVLTDMHGKKLIRARAEYEYDPLNRWRTWTMQTFVHKPLAWSMHKLKTSIGWSDDLNAGLLEYVHLPVLKQFCMDLYAMILPTAEQTVKLLPYATVCQNAKDILHLTEQCLLLCLFTLECQQKLGILRNAAGIQLIKVTPTIGTQNFISQTDLAKHNLESTQVRLLQQLHEIQLQIEQLEQQARDYVKQKKMQLAKIYLRRKRLLESNCEQRSIALLNIETLLCSMEEALSNNEVFDAYKIGSASLQQILDSNNLTIENVDDVMDHMSVSLETHKEVQDALSNVEATADALNLPNVDDDELEKELQDLLQKELQQKQEQAELCLQNEQNNNKETEAAITVANANATASDNDNSALPNGAKDEQCLLTTFTQLQLQDNGVIKLKNDLSKIN